MVSLDEESIMGSYLECPEAQMAGAGMVGPDVSVYGCPMLVTRLTAWAFILHHLASQTVDLTCGIL